MIRLLHTLSCAGMLALCCLSTAQFGDSFGPMLTAGGGRGSGTKLFPVDKREIASPEQIRSYVAKLGPGIYHRMSGCIPPPRWGFGSPADLAAAHLVKIGAPAIPFVVPVCSASDEATRALAIEVLSRIGDASVIPILIEAVTHDTSDRVRISAAEGLAWSSDPRAVHVLANSLDDKCISIQMFAVRALSIHPQQSALNRLAELVKLASHSYPSIAPRTSPAMVAEAAAYALGVIGPPAYDTIMGLFAIPDEYVNRAAAVALSQCNDRRAIPKLIELCESKEDMTRLQAAQALARWPDPRSIRALTNLMQHGGGNSSGIAMQSLAQIGGPALDLIFAAATAPHPVTRQFAASCFSDIRDRSAATRLASLLSTSKDEYVRQMAMSTLGFWKDVRAIPALLKMAAEPDMEHRRLAIGVLGQYDDRKNPEIVAPMLIGMTDKHPWVRSQAAGALFNKHDKRIVPLMKRLLQSPIKDVPPLAQMVLKQYHA